MPFRDDDRQELDPREFPEPEDAGADLMPCPHCLAVMHEETERCPACGLYLSREDMPAQRPWWVVLGVLLCLGVTLFWIWAGL